MYNYVIVHYTTCAGRDSHNLDTSIDNSKSGMLYCTDSQPVADAQLLYSNSSQPVVDATLLHSNSSIPDTENEMNDSNSIYNHEHNVDMQKVKNVLKITELTQFQIECAAVVRHGQDAIVVQPTGCGKSLCFVIPTLCSLGKISLVVEPAVSVITNQVDSLLKKSIQAPWVEQLVVASLLTTVGYLKALMMSHL